jgi:hypothetical protein
MLCFSSLHESSGAIQLVAGTTWTAEFAAFGNVNLV